jgi:AbrB family looped-hinge helix DNA binding protein
MRVTSKGQVTIPIGIREQLGITPGSEAEFELHGNSARLVKVSTKRTNGRGASVVATLRGTANLKMSTDEILSLMRKSG